MFGRKMRNSINWWPELQLPPINLYSFGKEDSPCTGQCKLEDSKCSGCRRTVEEITNWTLLDPIERWEINSRIEREKDK